MRRNAVLTAAAFLAAIGLSATRANAQGFSVYEHDACAMGRAGAGVASPCTGGSAIFFNPAGIVTGERNKWNVAFGVTMIPPRGSFTDSITGLTTDLVNNNIPVPNVYITRQIGTKWAVGVGMFAPYGLTTEWPTSFGGHFLSYKATIKSIYFQPTIAYRPNDRIQVGVGLDIVRSAVELHQYVDLSSQTAIAATSTTPAVTFAMLGVPVGTPFADARLHGTGNAIGFHLGVIVKPTETISLGARYMSGVTINGTGYAGFSAVGTGILLAAGNPFGVPARTPLDAVLASQFTTGRLVGQTVAAQIPMPSQLVLGAAVQLTPALKVLADVQLTNWKKFEYLPLTLGVIGADTLWEDYKDATGFRTAVEYAVNPRLNLRGGFLHHNAAAPTATVTPLLPEGARSEYIVGAGYQVNSGIRIDVAYQIIKQQDRRGRIIDPPTRGADVNTGLYKFSANLFGASVAFAF
jgi:long-chain fatty acid transport protein